jgi:hypothetical protein
MNESDLLDIDRRPDERLEVVTVRYSAGLNIDPVKRYEVTCPVHGTFAFPSGCFASAVLFAYDHFGHLPVPPAPRRKSRRRRIVVTL